MGRGALDSRLPRAGAQVSSPACLPLPPRRLRGARAAPSHCPRRARGRPGARPSRRWFGEGSRATTREPPNDAAVPAPAGHAETRGRHLPAGAGRGGRGSRRWFPGPALFSSPSPFFRLPSLSPGVGGTSPASSSLSNREGGKEPPALSCLPANFSGTRVSTLAAATAPRSREPLLAFPLAARPRHPGGCKDAAERQAGAARILPSPSPRLPALPRAPLPRCSPARASVGPSFLAASPVPAGSRRQASPRRPAAARDFSLCWMRTRAPRRRGAA